MVLIAKILFLAALTQALTVEGLSRRQDEDPPPTDPDAPPPTAGPGGIEQYMRFTRGSTQNFTTDVKAFRGNSTNLENDYYTTYNNVQQIQDAAYERHLGGVLSNKDAKKVCKYFNTTLVDVNKKFLATVVANKKKLIRYKYVGDLSGHLSDIGDQYPGVAQTISDVSYYGGSEACQDAGNTINGLFNSAISALNS